jgi:hypothetical protein
MEHAIETRRILNTLETIIEHTVYLQKEMRAELSDEIISLKSKLKYAYKALSDNESFIIEDEYSDSVMKHWKDTIAIYKDSYVKTLEKCKQLQTSIGLLGVETAVSLVSELHDLDQIRDIHQEHEALVDLYCYMATYLIINEVRTTMCNSTVEPVIYNDNVVKLHP